MAETYFTGFGKNSMTNQVLRHVCNALGDRYMHPSVATEDIKDLDLDFHALCYKRPLFDS